MTYKQPTSRDSSVGVLITQRAARSAVPFSAQEGILLSSETSRQALGTTKLLSNGYQQFLSQGTFAGGEVDHSALSSAELKDGDYMHL